MASHFHVEPRSHAQPSSWGWLLTAILATGVALASARYFAGVTMMIPPPLKANFLDHPILFEIHISAASIALFLGPWQFLRGFRRRYPRAHRAVGVGYVVACVVGGMSSLPMALGSNGGWVASGGFLGLGLLWLWTTLRAVIAIARRDSAAHGLWMKRSFALTLAGVTLRIYLPIAFLGWAPFSTVYAGIAWACWIPNLILADWFGATVLDRR